MNEQQKIKCNKQKRKTDRKQCKYKNILLKEGIHYSDNPTKHIVVCNAGLVNGFSESELVQLFSPYGPLEFVTMFVGKSYSVVTLSNINYSIAAFENINGIITTPKVNGPLYLMYSVTVPECKNMSNCNWPEGLHVINDFITENEEDMLLKCISWASPLSNTTGKSLLKHRRVRHYGYEFNYNNNNIDKASPLSEKIPTECDILFSRLKEKCDENIIQWLPDQLTVNEYRPGQGIPSHVDTHSAFESPILSLSLGSDVIMEFKHRDGRHVAITLLKRSLLVMDGESRYDWNHGITPRKIDVIQSDESGLLTKERGVRTSFTFRKIRFDPCTCEYPDMCDSRNQKMTEMSLSDQVASRLEDVHVHKVYDEISSHFSETRHKAWPNVAQFVNSLPIGSVMVDVGCGNGKYLGSNKNIFEVGCDRSVKLCEECSIRGNEVFMCNCLQLPLKDNCADGVISIAVIHHLATYERRLSAIMEIIRILNVAGQGLIYVWAKEQLKDRNLSSYLKQDKRNRKLNTESVVDCERLSDVLENDSDVKSNEFSLPIHQNRTQFKHDDLLVPWKLKTEKQPTHFRYYHMFKEGELEEMFHQIHTVKVIKSYYDQGNWCVLIEKLKKN